MATKHGRFTKEFEEEAVRLVLTGGRTQREIAEDLGIGVSTLQRWLERRREAERQNPPLDEDSAAELKRLRREVRLLREERDILKKAAAFFAREGHR